MTFGFYSNVDKQLDNSDWAKELGADVVLVDSKQMRKQIVKIIEEFAKEDQPSLCHAGGNAGELVVSPA